MRPSAMAEHFAAQTAATLREWAAVASRDPLYAEMARRLAEAADARDAGDDHAALVACGQAAFAENRADGIAAARR